MSTHELTVFGVQPLAFARLADNVEPAAGLGPAEPAADDAALGDAPAWVAGLEALYPNRHFHYRQLEDGLAIEGGGCAFRLSAWLCSNATLNQHLVLFELESGEMDPRALAMEDIRALLVSAVDDRRPEAVKAVLRRACGQAMQGGQARAHELAVQHDTCNITLFLRPRGAVESGSIEWGRSISGHGDAERLTVGRKQVEVSATTRIFFGGRVHVVVSSSDNDTGVVKQVLFMLQAMWFYVPLYLRYAGWLHRRILAAGSSGELDEQEATAGRLVYLYQAVRLQNESAKISYEALSGVFYDEVQGNWGIERSIDQLQRYAEFFREFIKDVREVQAQKANDVMNYILFGLSLFGFVGLWANILASEVAVRDLGSPGKLLRIAMATPLGFVTVALLVASVIAGLWFIRYSLRTRRGGRARRRGRPEARDGAD